MPTAKGAGRINLAARGDRRKFTRTFRLSPDVARHAVYSERIPGTRYTGAMAAVVSIVLAYQLERITMYRIIR